MALDGNYSTLNRSNVINEISGGISSRIVVNIPFNMYDTGITGGHVIHYDTVGQRYIKSIATDPANAEVFGIVENINSEDKSLNVVISGSINLPDTFVIQSPSSILDDIYFLSANYAGFLENIGPTVPGNVIKPIYYKAPHGLFTGLVRNYLGYKANIGSSTSDPTPEFVTFSDNMQIGLEYSDISKQFYIKTISYSNNTFTKTTLYYFNKITLENASNQQIDYNLSSGNCEAKVSNDGKEIFLFNKSSKKIYHIHVISTGQASLKSTINVNIVGNPQDLLWAVDDEITCFAVGTQSLQEQSSPYNTQINAYDISSRIEYWKRNVNNQQNPYRWRRVANSQAKGFVFSKTLSFISNGTERDEIYVNGGVHRLSDLSCKNKNFALSYRTLIVDQIAYKTKISHLSYARYDQRTIDYIVLHGTTSSGLQQLLGISASGSTFQYQIHGITGITTQPWTSATPILGVSTIPFYTNQTLSADRATAKKYSCRFDMNHFKILGKTFDYYYDDPSYKKDCFLYDELIYASGYTHASYNNTPGKTLSNSIRELLQLSNRMTINSDISHYEGSLGSTTLTIPTYSKNALMSRSKTTETFSVFALLYEYINHTTNTRSKHLIITKYPFYAEDKFNVLQYYAQSDKNKRILPNDGTNYGYITSFKTSSIGPQIKGQYFNYNSIFAEVDVIPYAFSGDQIINNPNIDQINSFQLFTSNNRFFICTSTKIIVWTYASSTYIVLDFTNMDSASFWYNSSGEFFKLANLIYKYDSSTTSFILQTI